MGVPKFYRWLSERYPLINQVVDPSFKPVFDCLYLDMNGIVHGATHGDDVSVSEAFDMQTVVVRIFRYIDNLVRLAQPQKVLYLALDGVAPRAKMNQQRQRRFRSAKEAMETREELLKKGEIDSKTEIFDSNAITPGTEFMAALTPHMKFFIRKKINEDELWKNLTVIYSGHEVPGEGEHKIMNYIRTMKMQNDYDPNTSHCIYGLDADLIFLSLAMHEPHTALLREEVVFGNPARRNNGRSVFIKKDVFQLLHISLLREYFLKEFYLPDLSFPFSLERVIDDFILLCFVVGNDFVPHLPSMDIQEGALDDMIEVYKNLLPSMGFITTSEGKINFSNLQKVINVLAPLEVNVFRLREEKAKKGQRWNKKKPKIIEPESDEVSENELDEDDESMLDAAISELKLPDESQVANSYKSKYYNDRWGKDFYSESAVHSVCRSYVEALIWIFGYYYQGVQSWSWFYPHFYAPLLSDLARLDLAEIASEVKFVLGVPFRPCEQLMSVLPPASAALVPIPLASLMLDEKSPIKDFYPLEFETDLNGKKNSWEAIVLIPFVEEKRLLSALKPVYEIHHIDDLPINQFGKDLAFKRASISSKSISTRYKSTLPATFDDISNCKVEFSELELPKIPGNGIFCSELKAGVSFPFVSFPFMDAIPCNLKLVVGGINVFGRLSSKASAYLFINSLEEGSNSIHSLASAKKYVNKKVLIDWPYFRVGLVVRVSDMLNEVGDNGKIVPMNDTDKRKWVDNMNDLRRDWRSTKGVIVNDDIMAHVKPLKRMIRTPSGDLRHEFGDEIMYPISCICEENTLPRDSRFQEVDSVDHEIELQYPLGSSVAYVGSDTRLYGMVGKVEGYISDQVAKVKLFPLFHNEATMNRKAIFEDKADNEAMADFVNPSIASRLIGINQRTLGRITSSCFFKPGRKDLGLNLNFKKRGMLVCGMVKYQLSRDGAEMWLYSNDAINFIMDYKEKFPEVFECIEADGSLTTYDLESLLSKKSEGKKCKNEAVDLVDRVERWLRQHVTAKFPLVSMNSQILPRSSVERIEQCLIEKQSAPRLQESVYKLETSNLYAAESNIQWSPTEGLYPQLGDRVLYLGGTKGVPFGSRGTIVGIHPDGADEGNEVRNKQLESTENLQEGSSLKPPDEFLVDVFFDEKLVCGKNLGGRCADSRGVTLEYKCLLNITQNFLISKKAKGKFSEWNQQNTTRKIIRNLDSRGASLPTSEKSNQKKAEHLEQKRKFDSDATASAQKVDKPIINPKKVESAHGKSEKAGGNILSITESASSAEDIIQMFTKLTAKSEELSRIYRHPVLASVSKSASPKSKEASSPVYPPNVAAYLRSNRQHPTAPQ